MTSRIHRGFHRVGVVLVALFLLVAGIVAIENGGLSIVGLAILAAFIYIAVRAVGWVLAGFIGSDG